MTRSRPASGTTLVLIVADRELVRAGLRGLLREMGGLSVTAEVATIADARTMLRRIPADLVVADGGSERIDAIELARALGDLDRPPALVLMVSGADFDLVAAAVRSGVHGIVLPDVSGTELAAVIARALAGEHAIEATLATRLLVDLVTADPDVGPDPLTPRELEILTMISRGHTNREIAVQTVSAVGTVKIHVEHILHKLGVVDRTQAAVRAVELGLVRVGDDNGEGDARWHRPTDPDPSRPA